MARQRRAEGKESVARGGKSSQRARSSPLPSSSSSGHINRNESSVTWSTDSADEDYGTLDEDEEDELDSVEDDEDDEEEDMDQVIRNSKAVAAPRSAGATSSSSASSLHRPTHSRRADTVEKETRAMLKKRVHQARSKVSKNRKARSAYLHLRTGVTGLHGRFGRS
ncbi:hypothetical protein SAICODRAFT_34354 [Saitoella complicata NRRL Y-17804]|uniref:uncharacterized protein n=1 Tax=Saitoella complicata (strain BCRC 22490 / CBS 7301 / JCM 7358 / NBRC 10748 / NRRL Y-17804) TaxID=698492 RepID=UPI000866CDAD|nr:uncharacterized protein SAICODRAFT_34354 [Saitoella complicata NRRL Y-17804]ODQ54204.1 hypothetical protein SAICODRAFT_34354 [Saitoella complicata NRRL Y-17804]